MWNFFKVFMCFPLPVICNTFIVFSIVPCTWSISSMVFTVARICAVVLLYGVHEVWEHRPVYTTYFLDTNNEDKNKRNIPSLAKC
jgi:hypothetical protein